MARGAGVWTCVFCGGMGDAMGLKTRFRLTFSIDQDPVFFGWQIRSKLSTFSTVVASGIAQSKKLLFFDRVRRPTWVSVEKGRFRPTNPAV